MNTEFNQTDFESAYHYPAHSRPHSARSEPRTIHTRLSPEMARQAEIAYAAVLEVLG